VELVIEAMDNNDELFLSEAADLMFRYLVLLAQKRLHAKQRYIGALDGRVPLKTPKSRLATEAKAEFTKVNEHFAKGA
jgi:phosphoribosyl-ATP pyrophosphohydrolase